MTMEVFAYLCGRNLLQGLRGFQVDDCLDPGEMLKNRLFGHLGKSVTEGVDD